MFKTILKELADRIWRSYKSTIIGLLLAITGEVITYLATSNNTPPWAHLIFGVVLTAFVSYKEKKVKEASQVAAIVFFLLSAGAYAQSVPPVPPVHTVEQALPQVAPSDPPPTAPITASSFGGCILKNNLLCFQPSGTFTALAINLSKKRVEPALAPGLGYGFTLGKGNWYSFGVSVYIVVDPNAQQVNMTFMGKFFNGYFGAGWEKGFIGDVSSRIVFGPSIDI